MWSQEQTQRKLEMCEVLYFNKEPVSVSPSATEKHGARGCRTETGSLQPGCNESQFDPDADDADSGDLDGDIPLFSTRPKDSAPESP